MISLGPTTASVKFVQLFQIKTSKREVWGCLSVLHTFESEHLSLHTPLQRLWGVTPISFKI